MADDKPQVRRILEGQFVQMGFKKVGPIWERQREEVRQFLQIQRSRFAPWYFVNVGIVLREAEPGLKVRSVSECHLDVRAGQLAPPDVLTRFGKALSEEETILDTERERVIKTVLEEYVEPFLSRYGAREPILALARTPRPERPNPSVMVWWPMLKYAGVQDRKPGDPDFDSRWVP